MDTHEHELFEAGDNTALVCVDQQDYQKALVPDLIDLSYKVHLGLYEDDVLLKLRTYSYNVVVIYENFNGSTLATNPLLQDTARRPGTQRRDFFVILLTHRFATNDAMSAFIQSVDLIMNVADLANFKAVLRRGTAQHRDTYAPFLSTLKTAQTM